MIPKIYHTPEEYLALEQITLASIGLTLLMADVYEKMDGLLPTAPM